MNLRSSLVFLLSSILASACSEGGSGLTVDASADDGNVLGDGNTPLCLSQAIGSTVGTKNNVLTNRTDLSFTATAGSFTITTANLHLRTTDDTDILIFGDVRNDAATPRCLVDIDVTVGGTKVSGLVYGRPHRDTGSSVQSPKSCVASNETAPFVAITQNVSPTLLTAGTSVSFMVSHFTYALGSYVPHPANPTLAFAGHGPAQPCGKVLSLSATTGDTSIYNYAIGVFPRDTRGLIVDWRTAYHLEDVPASTTFSLGTTEPIVETTQRALSPDFLIRVNAATGAGTAKDAEPPAVTAYRARHAALEAAFRD